MFNTNSDLRIPINKCVLSLAEPKARTFLDHQTPLHYAAKNEAVGSIRLLLESGASINCTDYKQRTPLQLAANMGTEDIITDMFTNITTDNTTEVNDTTGAILTLEVSTDPI